MADDKLSTVTDLVKDSSKDDPIAALAETVADIPVAEDTLIILQLFESMDAASPLARLITASVIVGVSLLFMLLARIIVSRRLKKITESPDGKIPPLRWQAQDLVSSEDMKQFRLYIWRGLGWAFSAVFLLSAVTGLLMVSSWTLRLAARLITIFIAALEFAWMGFVGYLPSLITIIVIVILARYIIRTIGLIFEGIKSRRIYLKNFYPEWAETSFSLIKLMIYALTAVIIFPYLPGSSSPAFQGISIFVGVLVSLGSTTAVSNVIAGIVLTYTRAMQIGDQVEIAQTRGKVVERSTFVTRIQTLKNIIVSIPNSMVLTNNIINYSQNMGKSGLLVHTGITIGYDVPWPKVQSLLISAAKNTDDIMESPEPFVLQTSLEDNYVAYEINGWTRTPEKLPQTYSELHAHILDEFHRNGIEITSPAFRSVRDGNTSTIPETLTEQDFNELKS